MTHRGSYPRERPGTHDHPERPSLQRMAQDAAQGQEDVAAAARPAVGRRSLDDLAADPRRPDAVARHGHQAGPRPARAARRRRHDPVPRPRRDRAAPTRPPASSTRSARTSCSPRRRSARSWSTTWPSGCAATAAPAPPTESGDGTERSVARDRLPAPTRLGRHRGRRGSGRHRHDRMAPTGRRDRRPASRAATERHIATRVRPPGPGLGELRTPAFGAPAFAFSAGSRNVRRPGRCGWGRSLSVARAR